MYVSHCLKYLNISFRIEDTLKSLRCNLELEGKRNIVNVTRGTSFLPLAIKGFQRKSFNHKAPLSVKFGGEDGIDNGGLTREFMRLLLPKLRDSSMFTGPDDSRALALDAKGVL